MTPAKISQIIADQSTLTGHPLVRVTNRSRVTFASQNTTLISEVASIFAGLEGDVTERWGGYTFTLGLHIHRVPVQTHKGIVTTDLQIHAGNYPKEFEPWCKNDEESLRAKVADIATFAALFFAAISRDLTSLPVAADGTVFGRPSKFWLPFDLYPPVDKNLPKAVLEVPPIILRD